MVKVGLKDDGYIRILPTGFCQKPAAGFYYSHDTLSKIDEKFYDHQQSKIYLL